MVHQLVLPELGENIEVADVSAVLVSVGQDIRRDQPVIEVETEKASLEVPASADGRVTELLVEAGDTVKVGQVILVFESDAPEATEEARKTAVQPVEASRGSAQRPAQPAASETEPPSGGRAAPPVGVKPSATPAPAPRRRSAVIGPTVPAAPSVRALARELGVDVGLVPGSGPRGRISRDDVKAHAKRLIKGITAPAAGEAPAARPLPDFARWGEVERKSLGKVRRATAANTGHAWATVPHVTQFDRSDVTELESMRKAFNAEAQSGPKLTMTALVLKATATVLGRFPVFNASLDPDAGEVIYKRYTHLGVAVDTDRGLLVPVVRNVDKKSLTAIAAELSDLAGRARAKKIQPDELAGASFTVSNLGGLGTTYFSPIVNWPEVAILGVGRARTEPVYVDEAFEPRLILPLSVSYDHRLIDGADAARFLRRLAEVLEQPAELMAEASAS